MKKLNAYFLMLMMGLSLFTACDDDDPSAPVYENPEIEAVNSALQQMPGAVADISLSVNAEAGIKSIVVSGDAEGNVTFDADDKSQVVSHMFTVPADATEGQVYNLTYTLTDEQDKTATATVKVTATATPVEPAENIMLDPSDNGLANMTGFDASTNTLTLSARNEYTLKGKVFVNEGQTLVIEPGTVIKAMPGTGTDAAALIVARGARIDARGTKENPIIFTTVSDDVNDPNDIQPTARGLWGGIIILGKAKINDPNGESAVEGIPTSETRGLYGGNDDADNSGIMTYVSIRHGGATIGANNEINGLTLGGVGSGTTIHHIEVFANEDDGFEWFGGTVNAKYLISAYCGDDAIDWDQGYTGTIQYFLTVQASDAAGRGFESNGVVNDATYDYNRAPISMPVVANGTFIGNYGVGGSENELARLRQGSGGLFYNNIWYNFGQGLRADEVSASEPIESETRIDEGRLVFKNNLFSKIRVSSSAAEATSLADVAVESKGTARTKLTAHLEANGNQYSSIPGLIGTTVSPNGGLNPLLSSDGAAAGIVPFKDPAIEETNYIGAFGDENWAEGWTALDFYGFFK